MLSGMGCSPIVQPRTKVTPKPGTWVTVWQGGVYTVEVAIGRKGWVPAYARTRGEVPYPTLPSSRGQGEEQGGGLGRQLGYGGYEFLQVIVVVEGVGGGSDAGEF